MIRDYHSVVTNQERGYASVTIWRDEYHDDYAQALWVSYAHLSCIYLDPGPFPVLHNIDVRFSHQGQGLGSAILREVCLVADLLGWEVWLAPVGAIGEDNAALIAWYTRYGWVMKADGSMIRPVGAPVPDKASRDGSKRAWA